MGYNYTLAKRMRSCRGLGALDLLMNKTSYVAGESPWYSITGAQPDSEVHWSSTKNGLPTGENDAYYNHNTNAAGVWSGAGGAWTNEQVGQWTKTVQVGNESDSITFQVLPAGVTSTPGGGNVYVPPSQQQQQKPSNQPGFFDETIDLFGYDLPKWAVYAVGAGAIYWTFFKKK